MTCRLLTVLAALPVLAASAAAQTPTLPTQFRTISLHTASPVEVLKTMHWNTKDTTPLPAGVKKVIALQSNHVLVVEATPEGYQRVKAIVSAIDVPGPKPLSK